MRREPSIGQQFIELVRGMRRQAVEDVLEVREGIDIVVLAGPGEGIEDRRRPAAAVAPEEGPIQSTCGGSPSTPTDSLSTRTAERWAATPLLAP
jgi:hypothetical protein